MIGIIWILTFEKFYTYRYSPSKHLASTFPILKRCLKCAMPFCPTSHQGRSGGSSFSSFALLTRDSKKTEDARNLAKTDRDQWQIWGQGQKKKKKTWSKHKVLDKLNNLVLFNKATYDKLSKEVPNYQFITQLLPLRDWRPPPSSLARAALQKLLSKALTNLFQP